MCVYHFPLLEAAQTVTCLHPAIFLLAPKMFQSPSSISAVIMKQPQIISVSLIYIKISVLIVGWNRAALKAQGNVRCRNCLSWHILKGDRIPQPRHVTLLKSRVNHLIAHRFAQPHAYPPPSKMTVKPVRERLGFFFNVLLFIYPCTDQDCSGQDHRSRRCGGCNMAGEEKNLTTNHLPWSSLASFYSFKMPPVKLHTW